MGARLIPVPFRLPRRVAPPGNGEASALLNG